MTVRGYEWLGGRFHIANTLENSKPIDYLLNREKISKSLNPA